MEFVVIPLIVIVIVVIDYTVLLVVRAVGGSPMRDLENRVANLGGQVDMLYEELQERDE